MSETLAAPGAADLDRSRAEVMQATATAHALQGLRAMASDDGGAESTGNQAVDAAVRAVRNAANLPVAQQFAAYEAAHETLREVLASIEE